LLEVEEVKLFLSFEFNKTLKETGGLTLRPEGVEDIN